jgi:PAS domain S-box-containing protein
MDRHEHVTGGTAPTDAGPDRRQLRLALSAARAALWEFDIAAEAVTGSSELAKVLGYPADHELTRDEIRAGYLPGERERMSAAGWQAFSSGKRQFEVEFQYRGGDGDRRWLLLRAEIVGDQRGVPIKVVGVVMDITARKHATSALKAMNDRLELEVAKVMQEREMVWRLSRDLFVLLAPDGTIVAINPAIEQLGYDVTEVVGRNAALLIHPDHLSDTSATIGRAASEMVADFQMRMQPKEGDPRWFSWTGSPAEGLVVAIGRDIDEQKQRERELELTQEALRQSQKLEAIGQLTGGVAHDFNNLLTIIRSSADLLRRSDLPEDKRQRYVGAISDTADRAAKLTAQLLAFARRQALRPEIFDVGSRIDAIADMLESVLEVRVTLVRQNTCANCFVEADAAQFESALVNMVLNAQDAMAGAGTITLGARPVENAASVPTAAGIASDYIAVTVSDDGPGIPAELMNRLFEPFFTTKALGKGTGLGLSQVYGFAKQSGGEVTVDSQPGAGATFTIYLPRSTSAPEPEKPQSGHDAAPAGGRVLIVEDHDEVGEVAAALLQGLGYVTERVSSGEAALERLKDGRDKIDMVFSDIVMPGISGLELARIVERDHPEIRIVLASGYSDALVEEAERRYQVLQKPYTVERLSHALRRTR